MESKILSIIDVMCPIKTFKVKEIREPWLMNEAIEAIKDKDRAMRKAKRTGGEEDWVIARRLRNAVGRDLENLRADFLKTQQAANEGDPKGFWKLVSLVLPDHKSKSSSIWLKDKDKQIPPGQTAEFINEFFTSIGPKLAEKHKDDWAYFGERIQQSAEPMVTNLREVNLLCKDINPLKSSGMDKLSSKICKDAFMVLTEQLVHIFNSSLSTSIFPDSWKRAKVIPLFKGGDREDVGNYRPVSLLPLPGKLLEKIMHQRVSEFWENNNFLTKDQGGFRKGYSTMSTIADLTDDLFLQINESNTTVATFIDLRKAFDTVNLNIL